MASVSEREVRLSIEELDEDLSFELSIDAVAVELPVTNAAMGNVPAVDPNIPVPHLEPISPDRDDALHEVLVGMLGELEDDGAPRRNALAVLSTKT